MSNAIKSIVLTPKIIKGITNQNQYAFNVNKKLKKPEIRQICEDIFNTKVISVNTSILPQKKYRPNLKRALVKFEKKKPYSNLFQNIYLSNRLKTKIKFLEKKPQSPNIDKKSIPIKTQKFNTINNSKKKKALANHRSKINIWKDEKIKKNDSISQISQKYDYNTLMNILNFPDSFKDYFIKKKVENNKYENVIDFQDWIFLMKNKSDRQQSRFNFSKENFLFKPLTEKDKTDFALLQKTTTIKQIAKVQSKQPSPTQPKDFTSFLQVPFLKNLLPSWLRKDKKPESSSKPELFSKLKNSHYKYKYKYKKIKKKKKKNFLLFTYSFPLNKKLKLKQPLINNQKFKKVTHQLSRFSSETKNSQKEKEIFKLLRVSSFFPSKIKKKKKQNSPQKAFFPMDSNNNILDLRGYISSPKNVTTKEKKSNNEKLEENFPLSSSSEEIKEKAIDRSKADDLWLRNFGQDREKLTTDSKKLWYRILSRLKAKKKKNITKKKPLLNTYLNKIINIPDHKLDKQKTRKSNLFLNILSKTSFFLPYSLPRSLPTFRIKSKLKIKPKFKPKEKKRKTAISNWYFWLF
uniref:Large ribosomal subunit protein uL23c n=1 Tax=Trentepohlia odorata TaxID=2576626 RepID=A0A4Y5P3F8_9CHLO|nr:ribosomal protein L23 [Trentepohlia odorata]QCW57797.1 ribosomal protein L23 [Trentepohlia odorata]